MAFYIMLASVLFLPSLGFAENNNQRLQAPQQTSLNGEKNSDKPSYPILDQVFKAGLNQDQLKILGGHPTVEQQVAAMTPEQKIKVREGLREEEAKAKTPEDLKQIARGYLILDERQKDAGQNAVRVAVQLQKLNPQNPAGFTLAAGGYYQMNNFQAAAQAAQEALRGDPKDPNAITVYALSRERIGIREINIRAVEKAFSFAAGRDDANLPMKLPVKMPGKSAEVPLMVNKGPSTPKRQGTSPLLPITVPVGVGLIGYGLYRSRQTKVSETGLNPEPRVEPASGAIMTNNIIKAALGATVIVGAVYLAAPVLPVFLSASGQAAPVLAGSGATGSGSVALGQSAILSVTKAGVAAGGTVIAAKKASDYYTNAKHEMREDLDAYTTAKNGGKHEGTVRNYKGKTSLEIERAERSYLKQVRLHHKKIKTPSRFAENWDKMTPEDRHILLKKWAGDAERNRELADIMRGLLKERGL